MLIELPITMPPIASTYRGENWMAPVVNTIVKVTAIPTAIADAIISAWSRLQPMRCVAVAEATQNMTSSAAATQSGLVMTPARMTLITASWSAPRRIASSGAHRRGTR